MILDDDLTEEQLAKLAEEGTDEEKRAVAKHPNASLDTLFSLAEFGFAEDVDQNPLLPLHVEGGSDDAITILIRIAEQTERESRLEELSSSVWYDVRRAVALNDKATPGILSRLAKDDSDSVRSGVAYNKNTPQDILSFLSKSKEDYVRWGVADNESTDPKILELLAFDQVWAVRRSVAGNPSTPQKILVLLSKDVSWDVRGHVAKNRKTPKSTLTSLLEDQDVAVRKQAQRTLKDL